MTSTIRIAFAPVATLMVVAAVVLALGASTASAMSTNAYKGILITNGFQTTAGNTVDLPGLGVDGRELTVTRNGKTARVVILDYGSYTALSKDWIAVNGYGPEPHTETDAFNGRVLYWNTDSVLIVDFRAPNDPAVARAAGNSFLGLPVSQAGSPTATPAPSGTPTPTPAGLPRSGGTNVVAVADTWVVVAALVAGMMVAAGAAVVWEGVRARK